MTARKTTERHGKTLVRKTSTLTLDDLTRVQAAGAQNSKRPTSLPLSAINVAPRVFQWRLNTEDIQADAKHVVDLARAIARTDNPEPLEPILVMDVGGRYFVIDGHHTLDAYHTARWAGRVPVECFDGSLQEAVDTALERNKKNKLPMGDVSKLEAAWRLLVMGSAGVAWQRTQAKVSENTTVSLRTVKRMAAVLKKHGDSVSALTWAKARREERDAEFEADVEWKEKKARKLADKLIKCGALAKDPEITARALSMISSHLPGMLVSEWPSEATDLVLGRLRESHPDAADSVEDVMGSWLWSVAE